MLKSFFSFYRLWDDSVCPGTPGEWREQSLTLTFYDWLEHKATPPLMPTNHCHAPFFPNVKVVLQTTSWGPSFKIQLLSLLIFGSVENLKFVVIFFLNLTRGVSEGLTLRGLDLDPWRPRRVEWKQRRGSPVDLLTECRHMEGGIKSLSYSRWHLMSKDHDPSLKRVRCCYSFLCRSVPSAGVKSWSPLAQFDLDMCRGACLSSFVRLNCGFVRFIWK